MASVDNSVKFLGDLTKLGCNVVTLVKSGASVFSIIMDAGPLLSETKALVADGKLALPELKDLDTNEVLALGQAAYDCISAIVKAAV